MVMKRVGSRSSIVCGSVRRSVNPRARHGLECSPRRFPMMIVILTSGLQKSGESLQAADQGDTTTLDETLCEAGMAVTELVRREAELQPDDKPKVNVDGIEELVADKDYHSSAVVQRVKSY